MELSTQQIRSAFRMWALIVPFWRAVCSAIGLPSAFTQHFLHWIVLSKPLLWILLSADVLYWSWMHQLKSLSLCKVSVRSPTMTTAATFAFYMLQGSVPRERTVAGGKAETKKFTYIPDKDIDWRYRGFPFISTCLFHWFHTLCSLSTRNSHPLCSSLCPRSDICGKAPPAGGEQSIAACSEQQR